MAISELKKPPNYQSGNQLNNRYHDAKQEWDEREGRALAQAYNHVPNHKNF